MKVLIKKWVSYTSYPFVISFCFLLHIVLIYFDLPLILATWIAVLFGLVSIITLERFVPFRAEWIPKNKDWIVDLSYMVLVQILLVKFLTFAVSIALLNIFQSNDFTIKNLWPKEWPIGIQAILMVLMADFFRYWLHRLSHEWMPLWRLHAVHHSPHKLYSMNVGRFHPLEKSIQFIFDALPFIILGITENVLALYFVFYSINGFFQHCNIKIYLGPLNYVISGPELHRWHHSMIIKESNKNFGNNLIVWDLLFGTWHLPKAKKVEQLGLINRNYPLGLIEQLKSPFIKGLDQDKSD